MTGEPLSPLAARLAAAVAAARAGRVGIEVLHAAAHEADADLAAAPDARARLRAACDELAAAGVIRLPRVGGPDWETLPRPALPRRVTRVGRSGTGPPAPRPEPATPEPSWHADLAWAPAFLRDEHPTTAERALLDAVQALLVAGGPGEPVAAQERSLQLVDDEAALDRLRRGRLFEPRRLSPALLGIRRVLPRPTAARLGTGPVTLLVENYATWDSLVATLPVRGRVGNVVWGMGDQLTTVLAALADDPRPPQELAYFGDLDAAGLDTARRGAELAPDLGLPALAPVAMLYEWLLEAGRPQPGHAAPAEVDTLTAWLPEALRERVATLLGDAHRLAQEWVCRELLADRDLRELR